MSRRDYDRRDRSRDRRRSRSRDRRDYDRRDRDRRERSSIFPDDRGDDRDRRGPVFKGGGRAKDNTQAWYPPGQNPLGPGPVSTGPPVEVDDRAKMWMKTLGATEDDIHTFSTIRWREFKLADRWPKSLYAKKVESFVQQIGAKLPPPFSAITATLRCPALVEQIVVPRILWNLDQLQIGRPDNYIQLVTEQPIILMHPEKEFEVSEKWTDYMGMPQPGTKKPGEKLGTGVMS